MRRNMVLLRTEREKAKLFAKTKFSYNPVLYFSIARVLMARSTSYLICVLNKNDKNWFNKWTLADLQQKIFTYWNIHRRLMDNPEIKRF